MRELSPYVLRNTPAVSSGILHLPPGPPPRVAGEGIGIVECWQVVKKHSRVIRWIVGSVLLMAGIVLFSMTPNFTAKATLLIEPEPPRILDIKELIQEGSGSEDYGYYKTQFNLLQSRDLAASVIDQLKLMQTPLFGPHNPGVVARAYDAIICRFLNSFIPEGDQAQRRETALQRAIDVYLGRLTVTPTTGTRLVVVSFSAPDSIMAQRIVQTHVREYISRNLELSNESRRSAVSFLQKELVKISEKVQTSEAALEAYRKKAGIVSFDVENAHRIAEKRMEHLTQALTDVETKRIAAQAQVQLVRSGNYDTLPQVITNPVISSLEPRVQQLEDQYANMSMAFNPAYPKLAELKAQMIEARSGLQREIREVAGAVERTYNADVDEENQLRSKIEAEKDRDFALNDASLKDAVLAREVETNRQLYQNVLLRMQQIAVGEQAPITNISVVDHAVVPSLPSSPKKRLDLAIVGLIALFSGIVTVFILEHFDDRLKSTKEAEEYLQLAALAVAPDFSKLDFTSGFLSKVRQLISVRMGKCKNIPQSLEDTASRGDVYKSVRTALLFSRGEPPPKLVLITSGVAGEGKTWTAVQTALAFAQTGVRTLLIDADLRRARCHEALKLRNEIGLSEVLVGRSEPEEAIRYLESRNLFLLTAGSRVRNPSELLTSSRMSEMLDWISKDYDQILIDSAPLTCASDTGAIATMTDGVLLVADAKTSKEDVRRASELLSFVGANVLGVVLNRVDSYHPDYKRYSRYYFSYDDPVENESCGT